MMNIISRALITPGMSGPKKVVLNTMRGLKSLGYQFVVNKQLNSSPRLWVHDDPVALKYIHTVPPHVQVVVGPNIYIWPRNIPESIKPSRAVWLQPSSWVAESWKRFGFNACPLEVWPTGIDTEEYAPSKDEKDTVIVYVKTRKEDDVTAVIYELESRNVRYLLFRYGSYRESDYKLALKRSRFAVWLAGSESQNIALGETLSAGVPVVVWDIRKLGERKFASYEQPRFSSEELEIPVTSAPYFSGQCGIIIHDKSQLSGALDQITEVERFQPRKYIINNLSLEKQARELMAVYDRHFGPADNRQILPSPAPWKLGTWYYTIWWQLVSRGKKIIKKIIH
jgi:hypothetical protein